MVADKRVDIEVPLVAMDKPPLVGECCNSKLKLVFSKEIKGRLMSYICVAHVSENGYDIMLYMIEL